MHQGITKDFRKVLAEIGLIKHNRPDYHFGKIIDCLVNKLGSIEELALTSDSDLVSILEDIRKDLKNDNALARTD